MKDVIVPTRLIKAIALIPVVELLTLRIEVNTTTLPITLLH
jgi:hypothetical protein